MATTNCAGNRSLSEVDPVIKSLVDKEKIRQSEGLELIASENFTSKAVMEVLGSCLTNKYAEGLPGKRYYGGNEYVDQIENLCISRALEAFHCDPNEWGVNVQPYSGSVANLEAYNSVLDPGDVLMGLAIADGGHLSHGHQTPTKKISATSIFYKVVNYKINSEGLLDYDEIDSLIQQHKPKMFVAGASAYPRDWKYDRLRQSCDKVNCFLLVDIAHISGLVLAQEQNNPFEYAHFVTTTTHKSLRGPRSGMIFYRKNKFKMGDVEYDLDARLNFSVFPSYQGGPHENQIGATAVALHEAMQPEFKQYAKQIKSNAKALAQSLIDLGHTIQTGGTDNHLMLWSLRPYQITGNKVERVCELALITVNKNMVQGDTNAFAPGGVRLGTPALTSRGMKEEDMKVVAGFLDEALKISIKIRDSLPKDVKQPEFSKEAEKSDLIQALKAKVIEFTKKFPIPG